MNQNTIKWIYNLSFFVMITRLIQYLRAAIQVVPHHVGFDNYEVTSILLKILITALGVLPEILMILGLRYYLKKKSKNKMLSFDKGTMYQLTGLTVVLLNLSAVTGLIVYPYSIMRTYMSDLRISSGFNPKLQMIAVHTYGLISSIAILALGFILFRKGLKLNKLKKIEE